MNIQTFLAKISTTSECPHTPSRNTHRRATMHFCPIHHPIEFRPWIELTINKLLEAGMIQRTMSTWASPVIVIPKKGLEVKLEDAKKPSPVDVKLRLVCDYCKLNQKLHAYF